MLTGLSGYLPENTLTLYDNLEFLIRLLLSAGLGALASAPTASSPAPRRCL